MRGPTQPRRSFHMPSPCAVHRLIGLRARSHDRCHERHSSSRPCHIDCELRLRKRSDDRPLCPRRPLAAGRAGDLRAGGHRAVALLQSNRSGARHRLAGRWHRGFPGPDPAGPAGDAALHGLCVHGDHRAADPAVAGTAGDPLRGFRQPGVSAGLSRLEADSGGGSDHCPASCELQSLPAVGLGADLLCAAELGAGCDACLVCGGSIRAADCHGAGAQPRRPPGDRTGASDPIDARQRRSPVPRFVVGAGRDAAWARSA